MIGEDQNFSEEDDSEDEWDKYVYENVTQKKCDSDANDEIETTDEIETVDIWNSEYDDNFAVQNNDDVMMNEHGVILIQMKTRLSIRLIAISS